MLLDTNIVIGYLNEDADIVDWIDTLFKERGALSISAITIAETLALPRLSNSDITRIRAFLDNFTAISFDTTIAEETGALRRGYRVTFADAGIAATALHYHTIDHAQRPRL